jgi:hypothetical protein
MKEMQNRPRIGPARNGAEQANDIILMCLLASIIILFVFAAGLIFIAW